MVEVDALTAARRAPAARRRALPRRHGQAVLRQCSASHCSRRPRCFLVLRRATRITVQGVGAARACFMA